MCVHADQKLKASRAAALLGIDAEPPAGWQDHETGIWPGRLALVAMRDRFELRHFGWREERPGKRVAVLVKWLHNARLETISSLPTWRAAWWAGQRCVVPVSAWYEPKGPGEEWRFEHRQEGISFIGAIWDVPAGGAAAPCMSLVTIEPPAAVLAYHDRMPLPLDAAQARRWLNPAQDPAALQAEQWQPDPSSLTIYAVLRPG